MSYAFSPTPFAPVLAALVLAGCTAVHPDHGGATQPVAVPDRNQMQAQSLVFYLELLHRFAKAGQAEQAEIFANIRRDFESTPSPSSELRYALAVATPGHPSTDFPLAQKLLRQLETRGVGQWASFRELVADCSAGIEVVGRFLALLELYRARAVAFEQPEALGMLQISWTGDSPTAEQLVQALAADEEV